MLKHLCKLKALCILKKCLVAFFYILVQLLSQPNYSSLGKEALVVFPISQYFFVLCLFCNVIDMFLCNQWEKESLLSYEPKLSLSYWSQVIKVWSKMQQLDWRMQFLLARIVSCFCTYFASSHLEKKNVGSIGSSFIVIDSSNSVL